MEIISSETHLVVSGLIVMSVQFETVSALEISIVLCFSISLEGKVLALYKYPTSSFTYLLIYCHCPQKESEIVHY